LIVVLQVTCTIHRGQYPTVPMTRTRDHGRPKDARVRGLRAAGRMLSRFRLG
jgi:hypothetical protein